MAGSPAGVVIGSAFRGRSTEKVGGWVGTERDSEGGRRGKEIWGEAAREEKAICRGGRSHGRLSEASFILFEDTFDCSRLYRVVFFTFRVVHLYFGVAGSIFRIVTSFFRVMPQLFLNVLAILLQSALA